MDQMTTEATLFVSTNITTILIILLVMKINMCLNSKGKSNSGRKWDIIEAIVAILFGWISIIYILVEYSSEVFGSCEKKPKKEKTLDEEMEDAIDDFVQNDIKNSARKQRQTCKVKD